MEELLLSGCTERKRPQLCQCVYSAESGRLGAPVCGSPAASSRTLNKRISRVLGEPGRPQAVGVRTGAHARMCDDPPPHIHRIPDARRTRVCGGGGGGFCNTECSDWKGTAG